MADKQPVIICNGTAGLQLYTGTVPLRVVKQLTDKSVRCLHVSKDGRFLVWPDAQFVRVFNLETNEIHVEIPAQNTPQFIKISPKSTLIASWFPFRAVKPEASGGEEKELPNLLLHDLESGNLNEGIVAKKMSCWEPVWFEDESVCVRLNNTELQFYEKNDFSRWQHKLETQKTVSFAIKTNTRTGQKLIACYSGAAPKGQPSFVRIYRYPAISQSIAGKSFFKADSVNIMWSPRGDALLFLCVSDVDQSGKSYYGEQKLHFLEAVPNGQSYTVALKKDGPVHAVQWIPSTSKASTYCVIYGFIPARVAIFDMKGSVLFDFKGAEMKVNQIVFNDFGNIITLAGFGNLRGGVQVWDLDKRQQISEFTCPETTDIAWRPDGQMLLTATTAPRLRVGNGFKWWDAYGKQLLDNTFPMNVELYQIFWQPRPGQYKPPKFVTKQPAAGAANNAVGAVAAAPAVPDRYIPPSRRTAADQEKKKLEDLKKTDPAKEKKIQALTKKLADISKLKNRQSMGAELKSQQIDMIRQENSLRQELQQLKL